VGCDIHLFIEMQRPDGRWYILPPPIKDEHDRLNRENLAYHRSGLLADWDLGRNYSLFGLLAGVRERPENQFCGARGVPGDASPEYAKEAEAAEEQYCHSFSFATVAELLTFFANECTWEQRQACHGFLALLTGLYDYAHPDKVRVLFYFDG
jgi:hypothetical protein